MRGFVFHGPGRAELAELPDPVAGPGEVVVRVAANTVCGTDLRILRGEKTSGLVPGVILGHELAGHVHEVGEGVSGVEVGALVGVVPTRTCRRCYFCERGMPTMCQDVSLMGGSFDGGLADYLHVPASAVERGSIVVSRNPDLSPAALALAEPLACCLNGQQQYQVFAGDTVAILGAGPIGLLHCQLARLRGAAQIIVSDPSEYRRQAALRFGATVAVDPAVDDLPTAARDLTAGRGADVAVICVGRPALVGTALHTVRNRGRVSIFAGMAGDGVASVEANLIHYRELTVTGASNSHRAVFESAIDLIERGAVDAAGLITDTFGLSRVEQAIEFAGSGAGLKVAVVPD
ncbi:MAG: alcohol dehydrogenase catalytic domain-containing protein [Propionicimonas sp.]